MDYLYILQQALIGIITIFWIYNIAISICSLIKFKEDTRFLRIKTKEDFNNLKQSGFITQLENPIVLRGDYDYIYIHELLDYEKISEHYDLIYIEYFH